MIDEATLTTKIKPFKNRVLLRRIPEDEAHIYIPDTVKSHQFKSRAGEVVTIGTGKEIQETIGDSKLVFFERDSGVEFSYLGKQSQYIIVRLENLLAVEEAVCHS